ncbi:MAG: hypothetical protein AAF519_03235 [Bacteroidota bacterium]
MPKKKKKSETKNEKPKVNPELDGLNIKIDSFGEINATYNIDDINDFLNRNVEDKKLEEREDYEDLKSGKKKQNPETNDE